MPGTYASVFLLAFDLDGRDQPLPAFEPRLAESEAAGVKEARSLSIRHAGVVVWKRESNPVVGEEGDPVIVFQSGMIGDFD